MTLENTVFLEILYIVEVAVLFGTNNTALKEYAFFSSL